jgi:acetoin utilization deacetylase AcuC-like enzyme
MPTGLVWDERYMWHQNDPTAAAVVTAGGFVEPGSQTENPDTKRRFKNLLDASGVNAKLVQITPKPATDEQILRVHTRAFLDQLEAKNETGGNVGPLASFGPGGVDIIKLAAGGVVAAVDAVLDELVDNAYALVRPCGHHATADSGLGFAILNNGAIAALHALEARGLQRILFVDWDVHHGNGTQAIFWKDPRVLAISLHQEDCFPRESGRIEETGAGPGQGYTVNVPIPPGSGRGAYLAAMDRIVSPAIKSFRPQLIVVPCGFDAGGFDPLGRMMLYAGVFREMTRKLMTSAKAFGNPPIVMCHEGGYHGSSVAFMGLAVIEELSGHQTGIEDPFDQFLRFTGGQEIQPHQDERINAAARSMQHFTSRWSGARARTISNE